MKLFKFHLFLHIFHEWNCSTIPLWTIFVLYCALLFCWIYSSPKEKFSINNIFNCSFLCFSPATKSMNSLTSFQFPNWNCSSSWLLCQSFNLFIILVDFLLLCIDCCCYIYLSNIFCIILLAINKNINVQI